MFLADKTVFSALATATTCTASGMSTAFMLKYEFAVAMPAMTTSNAVVPPGDPRLRVSAYAAAVMNDVAVSTVCERVLVPNPYHPSFKSKLMVCRCWMPVKTTPVVTRALRIRLTVLDDPRARMSSTRATRVANDTAACTPESILFVFTALQVLAFPTRGCVMIVFASVPDIPAWCIPDRIAVCSCFIPSYKLCSFQESMLHFVSGLVCGGGGGD